MRQRQRNKPSYDLFSETLFSEMEQYSMTITKADVRDAVHAWFRAWQTQDIETLLAMEAVSFGFGFRQCTPRDYVIEGEAGQRERLEWFFSQMDFYSLVSEDFETSVTGDCGLAWGVCIEAFQEKGYPPEQARVRFSKVLTQDVHGWKVVMCHRDIQPFSEEGRYPKALTVISLDK